MDKIERAERLEALANLLDRVGKIAPKSFDIGSWGDAKEGHTIESPHACKTTACALGWAALDPELSSRLKIALVNEARGFDVCRTMEEMETSFKKHGCFVGSVVHSEDENFKTAANDSDFEAGEAAFGLDDTVASFLFYGGRYADGQRVSADKVAARLRYFATISRNLPDDKSEMTFEDVFGVEAYDEYDGLLSKLPEEVQ